MKQIFFMPFQDRIIPVPKVPWLIGHQGIEETVEVLGPNLPFVYGMVKFNPSVARLVCQDQLGTGSTMFCKH